jgi:hypothetical protein
MFFAIYWASGYQASLFLFRKLGMSVFAKSWYREAHTTIINLKYLSVIFKLDKTTG